MRSETALKIAQIQDQAMHEVEYQVLLAEYGQRNSELVHFLAALPEGERSVIEDYLGLVAEMHCKMLEIACR